MERDKIIELLNNQGYPAFMLDKTADKVENLSPILQEAFDCWVRCGIEPSFSIKGYSYSLLVEKFDMKPIGAFLTLDWLIREPEKALENLNKGIK